MALGGLVPLIHQDECLRKQRLLKLLAFILLTPRRFSSVSRQPFAVGPLPPYLSHIRAARRLDSLDTHLAVSETERSLLHANSQSAFFPKAKFRFVETKSPVFCGS